MSFPFMDANISTLILLLVTVAILPLSVYLWRGKERKLPPYPAEGVVATVLQFTNGTIPQFLFDNTLKLGSVFMLNLPEKKLTIVVTDPALSRLILDGDAGRGIEGSEKTYHYERLAILAPSIFSKKTIGEGWDWARKGVAPSFAYSNLYKSLDKLSVRLHELTAMLEDFSKNGDRMDLASVLLRFTLDFITTSMFGVNFDAMAGGDSLGCKVLEEISISLKEYALKQLFNPVRFLMFWDPEVKRARKSLVFLADFTMKIITDYRASHSDESMAKDQSILGHLMRSPYPTDFDRSADLLVFLVAGHDTTAFSLAWIIMEISRSKGVLHKLREEIDSVNPDPCSPFEPPHLSRLNYLDNIIKEGMRLWPVGTLGSLRECPCDLRHGDYVLPKGASIMLPYFAMFRTGIQDPLKFDPDRWNKNNPELEKLRQMHVPFSSGKRNCVGQNLAMLEMKLLLATIFRSFEFDLLQPADKELEWEYFLTLKPKNAFARVHRRAGANGTAFR